MPTTSPRPSKDVIVIGGGDTGNDCLGTAMRQGCKSLNMFEILPQPPEERAAGQSMAGMAQDSAHGLWP